MVHSNDDFVLLLTRLLTSSTCISELLAMSAVASSSRPKGKGELKAWNHLSSGALSGLTSAVILQPLDLLKTRLQQAAEPSSAGKR